MSADRPLRRALRAFLVLLVPVALFALAANATRSAVPPAAQAGAQVQFALSSQQDGTTVSPGEPIGWRIELFVAPANNLGLTGFTVDLVQDETNPSHFDLPPGVPISVEMRGFDWPEGFANPAPEPKRSGYGGVPTGKPGARDLTQIGGAQNTFGKAPDCFGPQADVCMGQRLFVEPGIGQQPAGQAVAAGAFFAPRTPGTYTLRLARPKATVLTELNTPPTASRTMRAQSAFSAETITFTVL